MRPRGTTLLELLLVLVLTSLLTAIGLPRLGGWRDRQAARAGAALVATMLDRGRSTAIRLARPVEVAHRAGLIEVVALLDTGRTLTVTRGVPTGLVVSGLDRAVQFGGDGLGVSASNRTVVVQARAHRRQVIISRLGRIR